MNSLLTEYRNATAPGSERFFMPQIWFSSITDPQGNVTTLSYDPNAATGGNAVISTITDPTGGQLRFSYTVSDPLKIVKVTRNTDGLSAKFQYTGGQLTAITDTIGITSSFHYAAGTAFIDRLTTPYGNTTFSSTDGAGFLEADMTNPLGQTERNEATNSRRMPAMPKIRPCEAS